MGDRERSPGPEKMDPTLEAVREEWLRVMGLRDPISMLTLKSMAPLNTVRRIT